jgi:hypothetical protein
MTSLGLALARTARAAALVAILTGGAGACEHTASLEPLSPRMAPAASVESRQMEALLTAVQRETRAQGSADAAREQLIAALFVAAREPAPRGSGAEQPASALQELVDRDSRTP